MFVGLLAFVGNVMKELLVCKVQRNDLPDIVKRLGDALIKIMFKLLRPSTQTLIN